MILAKKVRCLPTPEQEIQFKKSAGVARWAYNFYLSERERLYREYVDNGNTGEYFLKTSELSKYINNTLKKTTHTWLNEVSAKTMGQALADAKFAYDNYFKGIHGKPRFKCKRNPKQSFYVRHDRLYKVDNGFRAEKIGVVRTSEPLPDIPSGTYYKNPRISFDGKYWYIAVAYECPIVKEPLNNNVLGIDLGVKHTAVCSNGMCYDNINKSNNVKRLTKSIKRKQRRISRKLQNNISSYVTVNGKRKPIYKKPIEECKNYQKEVRKLRLLYRRITNVRNNFTHQTTTEIVKTKPSRIVMETLDVCSMIRDKHLSRLILEQRFYEFIRQMKYKCEKYGIEFIQVPNNYPSSKICSSCGNVKRILSLSERTYVCACCGTKIDRDYNASLNLAKYIPIQST